MKDLTFILAHPDDEVIFGCGLLPEAKRIICIASDENNSQRAWCKDRKIALQKIGDMLGIETVCFNYNSEFYKQIDVRAGGLKDLQKKIFPYIDSNIFTHNSWGEYGHLDHILINQLVRSLWDSSILTTGICLSAGWFDVKKTYKNDEYKRVVVDIDLYNRCKAIYDKYGCWTWSKEPIEDVEIYEINNSSI